MQAEEVTPGLEVHVYVSEFWTGVYADGELLGQASRISDEVWLRLLRRAGAAVEVISVSTANPAPTVEGRPRVEFSAALSDGTWPESEAELRELIARRQQGWAAVQVLVDEADAARRELAVREERVKDAIDRLKSGSAAGERDAQHEQ
jgi:hypothetical protein